MTRAKQPQTMAGRRAVARFHRRASIFAGIILVGALGAVASAADSSAAPPPGPVCDEPVGQTWCADLQATDCVSNDPLSCVASCVHGFLEGLITGVSCNCKDPSECHVALGPSGPICEGVCPLGKTCVLSVTPGPAGDTFCCDCVSCGPGGCCAGRPKLPASTFTGRVAVATALPLAQAMNPDIVVTVYDLSEAVLDSAIFNENVIIERYSDSTWNKATLGSVFGITLDPGGNIYVTASTAYSIDVQGICEGWGGVYRIDGWTGAVTCFADLFQNLKSPLPVGLGNITYDCEHDQFFVTNFEDGKIYRLDTFGNILSTFDHEEPDDGMAGFAPLGERLWGVEKHLARVYYSVWSQDFDRPPPNEFEDRNEIWSVPLDASGEFDPPASLEITLPLLFERSYSNPVSDIRFTPNDGRMLLAERGMDSDTSTIAHQARLLEYVCDGTLWLPSANTFDIGVVDVLDALTNSSGGVDIDYSPNGRVWATGDALQFDPDDIYGIQGLPATGGDVSNSYLIDYQGIVDNRDKTRIGDVVVNCPGCVEPPPDMVAWWPFDEVGGPIAVDIIDSHHGSHMNGPVPEPAGKVDGALRFDGVDDFVEVPHDGTLAFIGTGAFSVDLWAHHDEISGGFVRKFDDTALGGGFQFYLNKGVPTLLLETTGIGCIPIGGNFSVIAGWHHYAATLTACPRTVTLYVDGEIVATATACCNPPNTAPICCDISNTAPILIGSDSELAPHFFEGVIDEVELFDRVLTHKEVFEIYQAGARGKCKDCRPNPDLSDCLSSACPDQNDNCRARAVIFDTNLQQVFVVRCSCGLAGIWHVELDLKQGEVPFCTGDCPAGFVCEENSVTNPDGTIEITCDIESVIPTLSEWGLIVLGLFVLTAGTIVLARRRPIAT